MAYKMAKVPTTEDDATSREAMLGAAQESLQYPVKTECEADKFIDRHFPSDEEPAHAQASPLLTKAMTWIIILNTIQTGAECQWKAQDFRELRHFYTGLDVLFAALFSFEIIFKIKVLGRQVYFEKGWHVMDCAITVMMVFDLAIVAVMGHPADDHAEYVAFHSIGRACRIARFVRLIRVVRVLKAQPVLQIVVGGLIKSSRALVWILILLLCIMYFFAILFVVEIDHTIFTEADVDNGCGPGQVAVTDGGHETCRAATMCEQDMYFCNLTTAMASLLDVVVGAEWSAMVHPIMHGQPWMMVPFIVFFMASAFGMLNVIVGVIVDATAETKTRMEWNEKREQLRSVSRQWEDAITNSGLSVAELNTLSGEARQKKVDQRHHEMTKLIQEVIDSGVVAFPQAVRPANIIKLLKRNNTDELGHEDFTVSLGRLIMGDQLSLLYQSLINTSKLHHDFHDQMEKNNSRFDKLEAMLLDVCQGMK